MSNEIEANLYTWKADTFTFYANKCKEKKFFELTISMYRNCLTQ